jgi:hypothetical protein
MTATGPAKVWGALALPTFGKGSALIRAAAILTGASQLDFLHDRTGSAAYPSRRLRTRRRRARARFLRSASLARLGISDGTYFSFTTSQAPNNYWTGRDAQVSPLRPLPDKSGPWL